MARTRGLNMPSPYSPRNTPWGGEVSKGLGFYPDSGGESEEFSDVVEFASFVILGTGWKL